MEPLPEPFNPFETPTPQFLHDLFGKMPVAVIRLSPEGIILAMNPEAESLTGHTSDQIIGRSFWATMFPGKLFQQVPKFISHAKLNQTIRNQQMTLRRRDGSESTLLLSRFMHQAEEQRRELVIVAIDPPAELKALAAAPTHEHQDCQPKELQHAASENKASAAIPEGDFVTPLAVSPRKLTDVQAYRQGLRDAVDRARRTDRALEVLAQSADVADGQALAALRARADHQKLNEIYPPEVDHNAARIQSQIHDLLALCRQVCY